MIKINAMGDTCPIPVVKTKNAIKALGGAGIVEILVDNDIAVQNLTKMANQKGYSVKSEKLARDQFNVIMTIGETGETETVNNEKEACLVTPNMIDSAKNVVVAISSSKMGEGDDELGRILMKGFIFALTQLDTLPDTVLLYNSGAKLSVEESPSLPDLIALEKAGTQILTCGTCLNHFKIEDKLAVGGITNMYSIVEEMGNASRILRP